MLFSHTIHQWHNYSQKMSPIACNFTSSTNLSPVNIQRDYARYGSAARINWK